MLKSFVSASTLSVDEVKKVLLEKIQEEREKIQESDEEDNLIKNIRQETGKYNVVSLFSGAGGLDLGLELAGLDVVHGRKKVDDALKSREQYDSIRKDSIFHTVYSNDLFISANQTYAANFPSSVFQHSKDIRQVSIFPNCQIMVGGFPCPGFSAAGPRLIDDPRNFLYVHFIRALIEKKPEFFVAENVKGIMTLAKGEVFRQVVEDFASAGYQVQAFLINSRDYGVPQLRERVILIGTSIEKIKNNYDWEYTLPRPSHSNDGVRPKFVTLRDAIGDLPSCPDDVFDSSYSPIYMSRNRKKGWDEQSYTIQASGRQAPMWPGGSPMVKINKDEWKFSGSENRRLSVREIARIQTFPDWFKFSDGGKKNVQKNNLLNEQYKQIGNAVPVQMARSVLAPIAQFLCDHKDLAWKGSIS